MKQILTGLLWSALLLAGVQCTIGLGWEVNDDLANAMLLKGGILYEQPVPDIRPYFTQGPASFLLSWLYQQWPGVSWYGGYTVVLLFFIHYLVFQVCAMLFPPKHRLLAAVFALALLPFYGISLSFTRVAAMLAFAGSTYALLAARQKGISRWPHYLLGGVAILFGFWARPLGAELGLLLAIPFWLQPATLWWRKGLVLAAVHVVFVLAGMVYYAPWFKTEDARQHLRAYDDWTEVVDFGWYAPDSARSTPRQSAIFGAFLYRMVIDANSFTSATVKEVLAHQAWVFRKMLPFHAFIYTHRNVLMAIAAVLPLLLAGLWLGGWLALARLLLAWGWLLAWLAFLFFLQRHMKLPDRVLIPINLGLAVGVPWLAGSFYQLRYLPARHWAVPAMAALMLAAAVWIWLPQAYPMGYNEERQRHWQLQDSLQRHHPVIQDLSPYLRYSANLFADAEIISTLQDTTLHPAVSLSGWHYFSNSYTQSFRARYARQPDSARQHFRQLFSQPGAVYVYTGVVPFTVVESYFKEIHGLHLLFDSLPARPLPDVQLYHIRVVDTTTTHRAAPAGS